MNNLGFQCDLRPCGLCGFGPRDVGLAVEAVEFFQRNWTDGPSRAPEEVAPEVREKIRAMAAENIRLPMDGRGRVKRLTPPAVEVLEMIDHLVAARQNWRAARLNQTRAEELLAQRTEMLRVGKTDYLSVLEAEYSRSQARSNLLEAAYNVLTLTASLKRALGVSPLVPLSRS